VEGIYVEKSCYFSALLHFFPSCVSLFSSSSVVRLLVCFFSTSSFSFYFTIFVDASFFFSSAPPFIPTAKLLKLSKQKIKNLKKNKKKLKNLNHFPKRE